MELFFCLSFLSILGQNASGNKIRADRRVPIFGFSIPVCLRCNRGLSGLYFLKYARDGFTLIFWCYLFWIDYVHRSSPYLLAFVLGCMLEPMHCLLLNGDWCCQNLLQDNNLCYETGLKFFGTLRGND